MAEELVLDTATRDWVLVPLSVVMVLIGVLRYFVSKLMRSPVPSTPPGPKHVKEGFVLRSSSPLFQFHPDLLLPGPPDPIERSGSGDCLLQQFVRASVADGTSDVVGVQLLMRELTWWLCCSAGRWSSGRGT
jgi:hypothetical protein